jgi:hypothetical protein
MYNIVILVVIKIPFLVVPSHKEADDNSEQIWRDPRHWHLGSPGLEFLAGGPLTVKVGYAQVLSSSCSCPPSIYEIHFQAIRFVFVIGYRSLDVCVSRRGAPIINYDAGPPEVMATFTIVTTTLHN